MFKKTILASLVLAILLSSVGCDRKQNTDFQKAAQNPIFIHKSLRKITDIITYDIFPPPIANRIYAYSTIAGYEALLPDFPEYKSLSGQITGLEATPKPDAKKSYCFPLASAQAMLLVGKKLTFSDAEMDTYIQSIHEDFQKLNIPKDVFKNSLEYGEIVANHILAWSGKDNYKQSRSAPKYSIDLKSEQKWKPTPPSYADAVEPHWRTIRPLTLDSAAQFKPARPTPFSKDKKSAFYKQAIEVYETGKKNDDFTRETARFWDDNAIATQVSGHFMTSVKKITPGGHWLNITRSVAEDKKADIMKSIESYALVAIGGLDAFISCWDEKYRSEHIRPETYINNYIDKDWRPNPLQTPPFPEYTSGHSVVSGASSTILTALYGNNVAVTDSTEVQYGIPVRTFASFEKAAAQAAISRMYGGIHFRPAIENGLTQGQNIGKNVLAKIKTKNAQ
jgi:PAP2 superfamily